MGWAYGVNNEGREVGYGVKAYCDLDGCEKKIDRGLAYVCGSMHDGGEHGCGDYFCGKHIFYSHAPEQLCDECLRRYVEDYGEEDPDDDEWLREQKA